MNFEPVNPWEAVAVDPKRFESEQLQEIGPEFAVALGLALRGWSPLIRLNLLPKNLRRRVEPGWWRLLALLFALVVLGVLGLVHYTAYTELSLAKAERDQLQAEVEALRPFIAELGRLQEERKALGPSSPSGKAWRKTPCPGPSTWPPSSTRSPGRGAPEVALRSVSARALSEEEAARLAQEGTYDGKRIRVEFALQGRP